MRDERFVQSAIKPNLAFATVIEPVGDLTLEISQRLCEVVQEASRFGRIVVISLRRIGHMSWAGLCRLADYVRAESMQAADVRFVDIVPRMRSLMREVGLGPQWITERRDVMSARRIIVAAV